MTREANCVCSVCGKSLYRIPSVLKRVKYTGRVLESRLLVAIEICRSLKEEECVFHLDGNNKNNALTNLALFPDKKSQLEYEINGIDLSIWRGDNSSKIRHKLKKGSTHPSWKGGFVSNYIYVKCPECFSSMANNKGEVFEHRLVVALELGRPLKENEIVHHIDENGQNNQPENLMLLSRGDHKRLHTGKKVTPIWEKK